MRERWLSKLLKMAFEIELRKTLESHTFGILMSLSFYAGADSVNIRLHDMLMLHKPLRKLRRIVNVLI